MALDRASLYLGDAGAKIVLLDHLLGGPLADDHAAGLACADVILAMHAHSLARGVEGDAAHAAALKRWMSRLQALVRSSNPLARRAGALLLGSTMRQCDQPVFSSSFQQVTSALFFVSKASEAPLVQAAAALALADVVQRSGSDPQMRRELTTSVVTRYVPRLLEMLGTDGCQEAALACAEATARALTTSLRAYVERLQGALLALLDSPGDAVRERAGRCLALLPACAGAHDAWAACMRALLDAAHRTAAAILSAADHGPPRPAPPRLAPSRLTDRGGLAPQTLRRGGGGAAAAAAECLQRLELPRLAALEREAARGPILVRRLGATAGAARALLREAPGGGAVAVPTRRLVTLCCRLLAVDAVARDAMPSEEAPSSAAVLAALPAIHTEAAATLAAALATRARTAPPAPPPRSRARRLGRQAAPFGGEAFGAACAGPLVEPALPHLLADALLPSLPPGPTAPGTRPPLAAAALAGPVDLVPLLAAAHGAPQAARSPAPLPPPRNGPRSARGGRVRPPAPRWQRARGPAPGTSRRRRPSPRLPSTCSRRGSRRAGRSSPTRRATRSTPRSSSPSPPRRPPPPPPHRPPPSSHGPGAPPAAAARGAARGGRLGGLPLAARGGDAGPAAARPAAAAAGDADGEARAAAAAGVAALEGLLHARAAPLYAPALAVRPPAAPTTVPAHNPASAPLPVASPAAPHPPAAFSEKHRAAWAPDSGSLPEARPPPPEPGPAPAPAPQAPSAATSAAVAKPSEQRSLASTAAAPTVAAAASPTAVAPAAPAVAAAASTSVKAAAAAPTTPAAVAPPAAAAAAGGAEATGSPFSFAKLGASGGGAGPGEESLAIVDEGPDEEDTEGL
eukprot:tig00000944_g5930.t1